jgi:heat shock protein HtpX
MNSLKTAVLLIILTALFVFIGSIIGGKEGAYIAFFLACAMNFFSYWFSSSIVLKMYNAREIGEHEAPSLFGIVKRLAYKAGIPAPKLYIIDNPAPNAFATGRSPADGVVALTTGIIKLLNEEELEGVLAHEISHITGRDILIGTIAATFAGAVITLANFAKFAAIFGGGRDSEKSGGTAGLLITAIVAPLAAIVIQLAISRTREYQADRAAAELTKKPLALASALNRISGRLERAQMESSPATAHLFIISPLSGTGALNLFSTHPSTEERIKRLKALALR